MTGVIGEQASLFGAPETIERLFVGLMAPEATAAQAAEIARQSRADHDLRGGEIPTDRLHVTLVHVGDYAGRLPPRVVADVIQVMGQVDHPPFEVTFDRVGSFAGAPGRHPHVLLGGEDDLGALMAFRDMIWKAIRRAGVRTLSNGTFNPHVTLAYGDRQLPVRPVDPIRWRVTDVTLIHSEYGRTIYHPLGCWPLAGVSPVGKQAPGS